MNFNPVKEQLLTVILCRLVEPQTLITYFPSFYFILRGRI